MKKIEEIKTQLEEVAKDLYIYDSSYVDELSAAREKWNNLMDIISREKLDIDWKEYLPHYNCEGEKLW